MNILFVCLGNICRSPMACGIMKNLFEESGTGGRIESCGLVDWNVGNPADVRTIEIAKKNGIDISSHRARQIEIEDFRVFDTIIIMDSQNEIAINKICPPAYRSKICKMTEFDDTLSGADIEDPYHSNLQAFENTFEQLSALCQKAYEKLL